MRRTAVIIGGSSGIGRATAFRFAREGCAVVVAAPDEACVRAVVEALPGDGHLGVAADVTVPEQVAELAERTAERFGGRGVDVLVNSAGVSRPVDAIGSDFAAWDRHLQVLMYGAVRVCRAFVPRMPDGARVVNITSIHHERVARGSSSYGMAKAAVTQLTRSLALELAPRNILVNAVAPGFVNTPLSIKADGRNELETEWFRDNYVRYDHLPLRRAATPEEISGVVWFLAGPDASYMTGSVVTVDGGLTITF